MDSSGIPQLKTPAARPGEIPDDGSFPEAHVPPVK
jgi:hypothetical protein